MQYLPSFQKLRLLDDQLLYVMQFHKNDLIENHAVDLKKGNVGQNVKLFEYLKLSQTV